MLTKAYVEEIVSDYQVRVRIPIFDKLASSPGGTPKEQLSISPICAVPGGKYNYSVGDIVFVTFEDNDLGRPVILGQLYADIDNNVFNDFFWNVSIFYCISYCSCNSSLCRSKYFTSIF